MDENINGQKPVVVAPIEQQPNSTELPQIAPQSNRANIIVVVILSTLILLALSGIVWIFTKPVSQTPVANNASLVASNSENTNSSKPTVNSQPIITMKDWQTFKDERFDFTFQYPQDWEVRVDKYENVNDRGLVVVPKVAMDWTSLGTPPDYADSQPEYMRIRQKKGEFSDKSFANFKANNDLLFNDPFFNSENIKISYEDSTLGGKQSLIFTTSEIPSFKHIVVFINGVEYSFEVGVKSKAELDNILKTIKFLK